MFSISDYMFISAEAMQALQIVQAELHPNCQTWGVDSSSTSSKESLSVYGLFHKIACTTQGRTSLRQMFLRPTLKASIIMERQRSISLLLRPENFDLVKHAGKILRRLKNVKLAMTHLQKGVNVPASGVSLDRSVWATIKGFAAHVLKLRELASGFSDAKHIPTLSKVCRAPCLGLFLFR
jgi:DNA mismatch repair protein MSH5